MGRLRDWLLRGFALFGAAVAIVTELLSPLYLLYRGSLTVAWVMLVAAGAVLAVRTLPPVKRPRLQWLEMAATGGIVSILGATLLTALAAPPNTWDALAYHMPRVVYWAQAGGVQFFATEYFNQISFPPLAEYFYLHSFQLTGSDRFVNLVGWCAFGGCVVGVTAIAAAARLSARTQVMAALFCATLPGAILQASGAKNDLLLSLWLVLGVYFTLEQNIPYLALAVALACATKGTAYVFLPALLAGAWLARGRPRLPWLRLAGWLLLAMLAINGPQYARNTALSGRPLGFDSPFADGRARWRNAHPGIGPMFSNALRHVSEQLGSPNENRNRRVFEAVNTMHKLAGLDPQDPETTYDGSRYAPPLHTRHEANANQRWHLLLAAVAAMAAVWWAWRTGNPFWLIYAVALLASFLTFCLVFRWQPFAARLLVPLFILAAPLGGRLLGAIRPTLVAALICLFLLDTARLPALENWLRPLRGTSSVWRVGREQQYFTDMGGVETWRAHEAAADALARTRCRWVGIDATLDQLEYPMQALLKRRIATVRFVHTGVTNASARYASPSAPQPCAVICLGCAGHDEKIAAYRGIGKPLGFGRSLLFQPSEH